MKTKAPIEKTGAPAPDTDSKEARLKRLRRPGISDPAMILFTQMYDRISKMNFDEAAFLAATYAELLQHHPSLREDVKHLRAIMAARDHLNDLSLAAMLI